MKKYSSQKAHRGKTAYRTPSDFRYRKIKKVEGFKMSGMNAFIKDSRSGKI
jgi:hypothetical protein